VLFTSPEEVQIGKNVEKCWLAEKKKSWVEAPEKLLEVAQKRGESRLQRGKGAPKVRSLCPGEQGTRGGSQAERRRREGNVVRSKLSSRYKAPNGGSGGVVPIQTASEKKVAPWEGEEDCKDQ